MHRKIFIKFHKIDILYICLAIIILIACFILSNNKIPSVKTDEYILDIMLVSSLDCETFYFTDASIVEVEKIYEEKNGSPGMIGAYKKIKYSIKPVSDGYTQLVVTTFENKVLRVIDIQIEDETMYINEWKDTNYTRKDKNS